MLRFRDRSCLEFSAMRKREAGGGEEEEKRRRREAEGGEKQRGWDQQEFT